MPKRKESGKAKKPAEAKKKTPIRDIIEIIVAIVVAVLAYQGMALLLGTPMPMVSVVSCSMYPTLHPGDLILVQNDGNFQPGDIAIYMSDRSTVIHRIKNVTSDGKYVFQGDNNCASIPSDVNVPKNRIIGKAKFAVPVLGFPRMAIMPLLGEDTRGVEWDCVQRCSRIR